ncbi:hypothetical protein ACFZC6_27610 [Streptomyces ossamyceticus]|uniref:hypothetical protein n=1 Tax=Streptomyces ossamyceticus TaxID=249581 RepID=UPI0036F0BFE6
MALFVRLAVALGRHSDDLTGDDLRCAVVNHIPESVDLDWRKEFYQGADADGKDLAKDVPATAGTAGGKAVIQRWRPQAGPRPRPGPLRPSAGPRRRADPLSTRGPARGNSPGQDHSLPRPRPARPHARTLAALGVSVSRSTVL